MILNIIIFSAFCYIDLNFYILSLMKNLNVNKFDLASEYITELKSLLKDIKANRRHISLETVKNQFNFQSLYLKEIPDVFL